MPAGVAKTVLDGRKPLVKLFPPLVDVANPMLEAPPLKKRPTWNAETIVEPNENVSGSTSVLCWLVVLVYGSELIWRSVELAAAVDVNETVSSTAPAKAVMRRPVLRTGRSTLVLMRAPPKGLEVDRRRRSMPPGRRPGAQPRQCEAPHAEAGHNRA